MKNRRKALTIYSVFRISTCMLAVFAIALALVLIGLGRADETVSHEGQRSAEEAVRRAALCCYTLEGYYPESYEYLKEHYNPQISDTLYAVHYTAVTPDIMPEITVIKRQGASP